MPVFFHATAKLMFTAKYSNECKSLAQVSIPSSNQEVCITIIIIFISGVKLRKIASAKTMFSQNAVSNFRIRTLAIQYNFEQ